MWKKYIENLFENNRNTIKVEIEYAMTNMR